MEQGWNSSWKTSDPIGSLVTVSSMCSFSIRVLFSVQFTACSKENRMPLQQPGGRCKEERAQERRMTPTAFKQPLA